MNQFYIQQNRHFKFFLLGVLFLSHFSINAQLEVAGGNVPPWDPETLISNVFLGDGVEVTNITFNGDAQAVGYFTNAENDIGIERGIIMASGQAVDALGPNNQTGNSNPVSNNASCPELNQLTTFGLNDVAAYEITFIPVSDTLRFRYVFASEEYPEYACSGFNDVFGFFITGPNPSGGMYAAQNIAFVPDLADPSGQTFTNFPVTINNVNPGVGANGTIMNCTPPNGTTEFGAYYNDNTGGANMQYDGFLNVFIAQAIVTPCESYTIKLAVADAGDTAFDTAVFLEAKSFGTGTLDVEATTVSLDGTIVEGCSDGELCFNLPVPAESDVFLDYTIFGTAVNGVDYETIPSNLFIAAGDTSVCVPVIAILDNEIEPTETIGIDIQLDPCNRDTFWLFISDNVMVPPNLANDTLICLGDSLFLDGTLPIPLPDPPTFTNSTPTPLNTTATQDGVFSDIQVFGVQPFELQENVLKSVCIDNLTHSFTDDVDIYLYAPGGQFIELSTDNGANGDNYIGTCFTPESTNEINVGPNNQAPASATPFTGTYTPEGNFPDLWDGDSPSNGTWSLFLYDDANGFSGTLNSWTICFNPLYQLEYSWSPTAGLSCFDCPDPIAKPDVTTNYVLTVTDSYGCSVQDSILIEVLDILDAPTITCGTITNNSITFEWNDVGGTSYEVNINGTGWVPASGPLSHLVDGLLLNETVTIEVRGISNCNGAIGTETCMTPDCPAPTLSVVNTVPTSCYGLSDGSLEVEGMGANPPFVYTIDGTNTFPSGLFTGLPAGTYSVQVIDNLACGVTIDVTVPSPDTLISVDMVIDSVTCNSFSDGQGTVTVTGGTPNPDYNYLWSTGSITQTALNLVAGENYVTITDGNGCEVIDTVTIGEPDVLLASIIPPAIITCAGDAKGEATVEVFGGTAGYTFDWGANAGNQGTATATGLAANIPYIVEVTDANGCNTLASVTLDENPPITFTSTSSVDASCNGVNDGSATVTPAGGVGGFTYQWQDASMQITQTATSLTVGTYTVVVSDALGCTADTTVSISSPNPMLVGTNILPTSCFESSDGSVELIPSGGTPGYTFAWSAGGPATAVRNDLPSGMQTATVTDMNGCFVEVDLDIPSPPDITITLNATDVNCGGGDDGTATAMGTGGAGGIDFVWSSGTNPIVPNVTGLTAGWVYVTATDANLCTKIDSIEISEPTPISFTTDATGVDCFGNSTGTATVNPSGGAGGFTFLWDANANNQITATATSLPMGTYSVTIIDMNLCEMITTVDVTEPPVLTTGISSNDANCFAATDGNITVTPSGGAMLYTYLWTNGQSTSTATSLAAGTYTVTISDGNGCTITETAIINSPSEITLDIVGTDVFCFGQNDGSAISAPAGGAGNFTYLWSDGQTTQNANSLTAGTYTLTVTDGNMCTTTETIIIGQPAEFSISNDIITNADCNGANTGGVDITITGGTAPLVYQWTGGTTAEDIVAVSAGTYTVIVTDANNCSITNTYIIDEPPVLSLSFNPTNVNCFMGNDGLIDLEILGGTSPYNTSWTGPNGFVSMDEDIQDLLAGNYQVTVKDVNGCEIIESVLLTQPATGVSLVMSQDDEICFSGTDGTLSVTPSGGTPPYNYIWDDTNAQTTQTATGLIPGTYEVIVSDGSGCTFTGSATVKEQPEITVNLSQLGASCHNTSDGTATIESIFIGNSSSNISDFNIAWNTTPNQSSSSASSLTGGETYTVEVTNALGCTATASIQIDQPAEVFASITTTTDVTCFNGNDGTATAEGLGGTSPYTFAWSSNANNQTTETATDLENGNYTVIVFDANGCTATATADIGEPDALSIRDFEVTDVLCKNGSTGSMSVSIEGGTPPYNYDWSNGFGVSTINDLGAGTYTVTVTDINGCSIIGSEAVREPAELLTGTLDFTDVTCFDGFDGQIFMASSGGTPPYNYSVDGINFNGSPTQLGISAGIYPEVMIVDANGCDFRYDPVSINQPPAVSVNLGPDTTLIYGEGIWLTPDLNVGGNISYSWSPPNLPELNCNDCATVFIDSLSFQTSIGLEIIDESGCKGSDIMTIFVRKLRELLVPTGFSPNGDNVNDLLLVHGREGSRVLTFQVFDRWGEKVYERYNFEVNDQIGWDGTFKGQLMNPGVFIWQAEIQYEDGARDVYKGNTTLIR